MSVCQLVASPARRSKQANAHGDPISPSPLRCSCSPIYATPHDILDHNVHVRHARPRGLFKKAGPSAVRLLTAGLDQVTWYGGTFGGTGAALSPPVAPLDIGWNHRRCRISISLLPLELSAVRGRCCPTQTDIRQLINTCLLPSLLSIHDNVQSQISRAV